MNNDVDLKSLLELQQYLLLNPEGNCDWCSSIIGILTFVATLFTLILAWAAFSYTKREYSLHLAKGQSETLSHFNERYSSDKNIEKVVTYYINKIENTPHITEPTIFEKEMFLRFFEELQYAIEQNAISKDMAFYMFSYYAIKAYEEGDDFVNDMHKGNWKRFCKFAKDMLQIKNKSKYN